MFLLEVKNIYNPSKAGQVLKLMNFLLFAKVQKRKDKSAGEINSGICLNL